MRKIKFRVWDNQVKRYVDNNSHISITPNGEVWEGAIDEEEITNVVTLEQYTGLKDKNGVEIYEGDIVKDEYYYKPLPVKFINGGFWLKRDDDTLTIPNKEYREVIGNIHEEE